MSMDGFVDLVDDLLRVSDDKKEVVTKKSRSEVSVLDLVVSGDAEGLTQLLKDDADFAVNARDPKTGRALLHEACARGDMGIVKLLLMKTEADLMLRTMLGRCTPLHLAVSNNHRPIVFLLLSHGADALSRDRFGCSPLHYVKSPSVAKLLVQYGGKALDYNTKKKHAVESVSNFANSIRQDSSIPVDKRDAALDVYKNLVKYLEKQAEAEYRAKLMNLQKIKKQTKEQAVLKSPKKGKRRI
ncbi:Ankyrin repeats (3 copies) [Phytophthora infestans]|uniref:Ankyrin repeats (3 copies) n=1 Tax=Phytophthora infestans TaxID=4787 RepID=A0A833WU93_PHYIN|nr:Ankyrin repeats (3 copies) [Phytophthora infestans]KAF4139789.1 Ankyrin repeats domain-containing protein [Phytophthora infestans]